MENVTLNFTVYNYVSIVNMHNTFTIIILQYNVHLFLYIDSQYL